MQALAIAFVLAGLAVHAFLDGTVLVEHGDHGSHGAVEGLLGLGVVLHRLPVGLAIVWLVQPRYGLRGSLVVAAVLMGFSTLGYAVGEAMLAGLAGQGMALFQAFVAGSLLHVVLHAPGGAEAPCELGCGHDHHDHVHHGPVTAGEHGGHGHAHAHASAPVAVAGAASHGKSHRLAGVGALLGLALLVGLTLTHPVPRTAAQELGSGSAFLTLALESAPALLLAFVAAALVHAFFPAAGLRWLRGGTPLRQAARGVALGPLLPICSCGVLPLYRSLVARGTPLPAALALLVAAPEVGGASMLVSLALLGGPLTAGRIAAACVTALIVGVIVGGQRGSEPRPRLPTVPPAAVDQQPWSARLRFGARVAFLEDVDHTAPWLLLGLAVAALAEPFLGADELRHLPPSVEVPLFALAGIPAYVCASGATPLVAVLLHKGLSPGAALAFLLTGPATNLTTFGVLARAHGRPFAARFAGIMILVPVALGYIANVALGSAAPLSLHEVATENHPWYEAASLAALGVLFLASLLRQGPRAFLGQVFSPHAHGGADESAPPAPAPALDRQAA
jgi:hypothetical protein